MVSILKKAIMAVTGLIWFGFAIGHLTGNLLLMKGESAFNDYAAFLESLGGLLYLVEAGLILFLLMHIATGIRLTRENKGARPRDYEVAANKGESTLAARTMIVGGIVLAVFVVTHVKMFKFGPRDGDGGLWGLVMRTFQEPLMVAWYVLAMIALGMHLSHGISSALQSLGAVKPRWLPKLRTAGYVIGWLIAGGFIMLPLWSFTQG